MSQLPWFSYLHRVGVGVCLCVYNVHSTKAVRQYDSRNEGIQTLLPDCVQVTNINC